MSSLLADSYIATGQAVAFNRGMSPERMAERSAAYSTKEQRDQELKNLKATEPTKEDRQAMSETQTLELQNALQTQKQLLIENNKRTLTTAYERYDVDGDIKHINTALVTLRKNGSTIFSKINRVDKLTEEDRQMMEDMGLPTGQVDEIISNPEMNKSYVRITQMDGTISFGDLDVMKGMTEYREHATKKELARQKDIRELEMISSLGYVVSTPSLDAFRRTRKQLGPNVDPKSSEFHELYDTIFDKLVKAKGRTSGYGRTEREAEAYGRRVAADNGFYPGDDGYEQALNEGMKQYVHDIRPSAAIKNVENATEAERELLEMGFLEMKLDKLTDTERFKIEQRIRRIEGPGGAELSAEDKKTLTRIRKLSTLGDLAAELTDDQTGIIDNMMRRVKKYVSDDITGIAAESAYQAFRNLVLHSFYGTALTELESKNLISAFGSLKQQRGPVLTQLKTTMLEVRDAYKSIVAINNEMVIKWRTGATGEKLDNVIESLDERIQYIDDMSKGKITPYATTGEPLKITDDKVVLTDEQRTELRKIFNPDGVVNEN